jgi:hypothetical protein
MGAGSVVGFGAAAGLGEGIASGSGAGMRSGWLVILLKVSLVCFNMALIISVLVKNFLRPDRWGC